MVLGYLPFKLEKRVRFPLALPNNASDCLSERQAADNRPQRGSTPRRGTNFIKSLIIAFGLSVSAASASDFIPLKVNTVPPKGAIDLCEKYSWACENIKGYRDNIDIVQRTNRQINQANPIEDIDQYGISEYWSLLSTKGGDCEDYALSKMKMLIDLGFDSNSLFMAVVLDTKDEPHAVLVWRTETGDYVLDNLTNKIKHWKKTKYFFIAVQNPSDKTKWNIVFK